LINQKILQSDDNNPFNLFHAFQLQGCFTYGDTRKGHKDKDKRENIRKAAAPFPPKPTGQYEWAFRISIQKSGKRSFDIENVPKLFIDAFCGKQIKKDSSNYYELNLYDDDTIDYVTYLQIVGKRTENIDMTNVEIYSRRKK